MDGPKESQFIDRPSTLLAAGCSDERIQQRRQFLEPAIRHARFPTRIGMRSVPCHRSGIEPCVLIDKHDGRIGLRHRRGEHGVLRIQRRNLRMTSARRGDELSQHNADARIHISELINDARHIADGARDSLASAEIVMSDMEQHHIG